MVPVPAVAYVESMGKYVKILLSGWFSLCALSLAQAKTNESGDATVLILDEYISPQFTYQLFKPYMKDVSYEQFTWALLSKRQSDSMAESVGQRVAEGLVRELEVSGPGGDIFSAYFIMNVVKHSRIQVKSKDAQVCYSACAMIWLSTENRVLGPSSELMFHQARFSILGVNCDTLLETGKTLLGDFLNLPQEQGSVCLEWLGKDAVADAVNGILKKLPADWQKIIFDNFGDVYVRETELATAKLLRIP